MNSVPSTPSGLAATVGASGVILSWTDSSDVQTPSNGLSYNLRVGTTPDGSNVVPPMSLTASGYRQVAAIGNVQHGLSARLSVLPAGTYYWSVQAVDTALAGSAFSAEQSFVVGGAPGAATLVSPSGNAGSSTPTYVWNGVTPRRTTISGSAGPPARR